MSEENKNLDKKIHRFKEIALLKLTLLRVKLEPVLGKILSNNFIKGIFSKSGSSSLFSSPKLKSYIWKFLALAGFLYLIIGIVDINSHYSEISSSALDKGQRLVINLPDGEISARKESIKQKTNEDTEKEVSDENSNNEAEKDLVGPPLSPEKLAEINASKESNKDSAKAEEELALKPKKTPSGIEDKRPRVIVIIYGLGLSRTTTENALSLPAEVSLSFSPYANGVAEWTTKANDLGYEILMDIPLEPTNYPKSDPGPYGLLLESDDKKNIDQLNTLISLSEHKFFGLVAPIDEKFTFNEDKIIPILQELKNQNLTFIYTNKPRNYFLPQTAKKLGLSIIAEDVILDADLSDEAIQEAIKNAEIVAAEKGFVVVIARPYQVSVKHLHKWLRSFQEKGLLLIRLSEILR